MFDEALEGERRLEHQRLLRGQHLVRDAVVEVRHLLQDERVLVVALGLRDGALHFRGQRVAERRQRARLAQQRHQALAVVHRQAPAARTRR